MNTEIAVFITTHETLQAEKMFTENRIPIKPVIKPRFISSECGMALEFYSSFKKEILKICHDNNLELVGIFKNS